MVRLHVVDHQIVGGPALQDLGQVLHPGLQEIFVHGIHDGDLLVQDRVGIVGHAVGDDVLAFEQIHLVVVHADVFDTVSNKHNFSSSFLSGLVSFGRP